MKLVKLGLFVLGGFLLGGCDKQTENPQPAFEVFLPSNFPQPVYDLRKNPVTREGFELGKMLFYDPILSRDNSVSCGSCHVQHSGFTQHGHAFSHGIDNKLGTRNSMPVFNMAWQKTFFWDGGVHDLDFASIAPLTNPVEMDESLENVLVKLRKSPVYDQKFKETFGVDEISSQTFLKALSQFMVTLVSANSRYDKYVREETGGELTMIETEGLSLFRQKCSTCHATDLFTDGTFRNNGLEPGKLQDKGRESVSMLEADRFKFKVPTLRNITKTAPYMHDGRFETLEEVLNHYDSGVHQTSTLDPELIQNGKPGIALSEEEKRKIVAFLNTLTDQEFLNNKQFAAQ